MWEIGYGLVGFFGDIFDLKLGNGEKGFSMCLRGGVLFGGMVGGCCF